MKHRLVKLVVQPVLVVDDGENLTEITVAPIVVNPADLDAFPERLRLEILALDTPAGEPTPTP